MYAAPGVKTSPDFPIPDTMKAWVLGNPGELKPAELRILEIAPEGGRRLCQLGAQTAHPGEHRSPATHE